MGCAGNWTDLPKDLVVDVAHRLSFLEEFFRFRAVCKSWKSATEAHEPWWLPTRCPMLLLAEDVAPGVIYFSCEFDEDCSNSDEQDDDNDEEEEEEQDDDDDDDDDDNEEEEDGVGYHSLDDQEWAQLLERKARYDYSKNSIGSSRGLYSLSSRKTYNIELPEASGRLILGTNKGWLLTLGRDLQIHLLHPLLRHQVSLPPMLTFSRQYEYDEDYTPEEETERFIHKVAMSSKLPHKNGDASFSYHHATPSPIVMAIYKNLGYLAFARMGDKVWTDVNVPCCWFHDIVYHQGNFYAVDNHGDVYVCCIEDDKEREPRGSKIASLQTNDWDKKYLVESSSGSDLLLVVRNIQTKYFKEPLGIEAKYRTTNFSVWRLNLDYYDSLEIRSCTLTEEDNLGDQALFLGTSSSFSVSSSGFIKPNSIYYTDDNKEHFFKTGGGHDMGIFDMESHTIEPHFRGKSIHPISPPLWCI